MKRLLIVTFWLLLCGRGWSQQLQLAKVEAKNNIGLTQPAPMPPPIIKSTWKDGQLIPQNFHTQYFGFFCRQELKMQEAHVPVTFRLGSMDDCNRLEQKPGYR